MNKTLKIICIILLVIFGILFFAEGIPNLEYDQYEDDCTEDELFLPQSFITKVGYCQTKPEVQFCNKVKECKIV